MNLMIVEDEPRLLNNLARNISWEQYDINVTATADNGLDAIRLFEQTRPSLLLMDIQIPEMDGLSVCRHILKQDPLVRVVLLSGHDNFAYAQSAIELNVVKYLLKPVSNDEIIEAVLEARERIRRDLETKYSAELMRKQWADYLPRLQDLFYQNWVAGKMTGTELERRSGELSVEISAQAIFVVSIIDPDPLSATDQRFTHRDRGLLQLSLLGIAKEYAADISCRIFSDFEGPVVLLFNSPSGTENGADSDNAFLTQVSTHTARLLSVFKNCLKVTASAGIGRVVHHPDAVNDSYRQACLALKERIALGHDIVIPFRDDERPRLTPHTDIQLEKHFTHALECGQRDKAIAALEKWITTGIHPAKSSDEMHANVLFFSALILRTIQAQGWPLQEAVGEQLFSFQNIQSLDSKDKVVKWLSDTVDHICCYVNEKKSTNQNSLVKSMIDLVEERIHEDIGLNEVAGMLYINPSYLSRLFKQQMGLPFTAYIVERKMKAAMQWLSEGMKVSETATLLGYRDFSYFTRVFRKHWGMTPVEAKADRSFKGNPEGEWAN